jgi:hypothetical protein
MRRMLATVSTVAAVLLAGCDSEATTVSTGGNAVSGTWNLTTVNGAALPFVIQSTPKIELVSEQLLVSANGTFTQASQVRTTSGTTVSTQTLSSGGTYTLSGTTASFIFNDGTTGAGTVSGNSLTVAKPGRSYVYDKP